MKTRPADSRGVVSNGWITSTRTFSNNSYYDPQYMGWGNLKVINDDVQQPGNMVPNHEHNNFDILGYLIEGELEHTDSLGNVNRARPGQIQHMWCGRGIWHTEASVGSVPARYLQIWIIPKDEHRMTNPYYEIIDKPIEQYGDISVDLKQDFIISAGKLQGTHTLNIANKGYLYVITGSVLGTDWTLNEGDGAELVGDLTADFDAHVILFKE
jgi:redox-sensitive bicupin YhaK (pirin superfamily)